MVVHYKDILTLVATLGDDNGIQVAVTESLKGGVIAGTACALGGLLLGPPGLAIGGAVGGSIAYYTSQGKFRPISAIIMEDLSAERQQELVDRIRGVVRDVNASDGAELLALVRGSPSLKEQVVKEMVSFFVNQLSMNVLQ